MTVREQLETLCKEWNCPLDEMIRCWCKGRNRNSMLDLNCTRFQNLSEDELLDLGIDGPAVAIKAKSRGKTLIIYAVSYRRNGRPAKRPMISGKSWLASKAERRRAAQFSEEGYLWGLTPDSDE